MGTSEADEAGRAQANLIAFCRAVTRWGSRGALDDHDGVVLCASGSWIPMMGNSAFRAGEAVPAAAEVTGRAAEFFGARGRGFCIKVRDTGQDDDLRTACVGAGMETFGQPVPEMLCRRRLPDLAPPDGVSLHPVDDEAGVRDFVDVNGQAYATYGLPAETLADVFDRPAALFDDGSAHVVVARRGAEPIATALVYESDGVAGIQWVGTVPSARTRGLGSLVTTYVTNLAFDRGASSVNLQASPMGESVYLRLGYETIFHYREYVHWAPPPGPGTGAGEGAGAGAT
jgi:GNAT superfamily N-acetyltransferase